MTLGLEAALRTALENLGVQVGVSVGVLVLLVGLVLNLHHARTAGVYIGRTRQIVTGVVVALLVLALLGVISINTDRGARVIDQLATWIGGAI
jgi:hypothetical protein